MNRFDCHNPNLRYPHGEPWEKWFSELQFQCPQMPFDQAWRHWDCGNSVGWAIHCFKRGK